MTFTRSVDVGDRAVMSILDPRSFENGGLEWQLRYGSPERVRFIAASVVASYDYLLSSEINQAEAMRRLRILRQARRELCKEPNP